jgi:glycosyltransferase involved in cell wall biosynthesis
MNHSVILIPAYNPDEKLKNVIEDMISANIANIVVVNDGSSSDSQNIFESISKYESVNVINHSVNQGKGRALKTGLDYIRNHFSNYGGVVTVDADGQHAVEDIIKVATKLSENRDHLILGVRDFSTDNIPLRSRFGNNLTKAIVKFTLGLTITDTQTGLRGIPFSLIDTFINVKGERYEYEMNMILECKRNNIKLEEVSINTIYIEENESSHFNPIIDSIRIYAVFIKFISSSLLSFGVDIILFTLFSFLLKDLYPVQFIIMATIFARILSSVFNYFVNRTVVFKSEANHTVVKYYSLSIVQMLTSAFVVFLLYGVIGTGEVVIKIIVDSLLFLVSFIVQREWVFKDRRRNAKEQGV